MRNVRHVHDDPTFAALLSGENGAYVESLFEDYVTGHAPVPNEWIALFDEILGGRAARSLPASNGNGHAPAVANGAAPEVGLPTDRARGIFGLIDAYRSHGHLIARLDPLSAPAESHPFLDPAEFGFDATSLDVPGPCGSYLGLERGTPRELIASLRETYCSELAVEFMEMRDKARRDWLIRHMEPTHNRPDFSHEERKKIWSEVMVAERFEQYLQRRFLGQKRFSVEGGEALIPIMHEIKEQAAAGGAEELVIAMAHRGRLNVLAHVMEMPYRALLGEFQKSLVPLEAQGSGDVKYHRGYSSDLPTRSGSEIHLSLCPNPSHLEAINPVAEGMTRAKQNIMGDTERRRVIPIQIHGDAAFNGQGIVAETLALSELESYWTGGTIHIIVNNRIGFTTEPKDYRFTHYPSDMAKVIQAPVFHVNADDPEACVLAARLATSFRQEFQEDVIIDLVCYRRYGHNEGDDPRFTQPLLYKKIDAHPTVGEIHTKRLLEAGVLDEAYVETFERTHRERLDRALEESEVHTQLEGAEGYHGLWEGRRAPLESDHAETAASRAAIEQVGRALVAWPKDFHPHPKLRRQIEARAKSILEDRVVDWGAAEALAFGTLLAEGTTVRLTGQDVERGTFAHRHAVLYDVENGQEWKALEAIAAEDARFCIANSPLSEAAVLGFEYGYSCVDPDRLILWEAQYGDFANGAQIIIDQFISSAEQKWSRSSGLVMLLPHGYEGHGPEHSSARLERYLQLCAQDNMIVCNLTTPAQIFHALRRQIHGRARKPLIVMSPKSLLRNPLVVSKLETLETGHFEEVIDDPGVAAGAIDPQAVRRVLVCSGRVYYTLLDAREEHAFHDVAIVRLEQLHPFPFEKLERVLAAYDTRDFVWVQEEPWNMGGWSFASERLRGVLPQKSRLRYAGRPEAAATATGSYRRHEQSEADFVSDAFAKRARTRRTRS